MTKSRRLFSTCCFTYLTTLCTIAFSATAIASKILPLPPLPEPVANNAVALVNTKQGDYLVSMMGLGEAKNHTDVHNKGWQLALSQKPDGWQRTPDVPSSLSLKGRLASVAATLPGELLLFGGYTVAADHSEISTPDVYSYRPDIKQFEQLADMPVPVDDSVALSYQQRYIYLVSGWHNHGNVDLVQVYDRLNNRWFNATPFPGEPVFGHAGAIVNNQLLICDGVKVAAIVDGRRQYEAERACYLGQIDNEDPAKISWQTAPHFAGKARYRMAAIGSQQPQGKTGFYFVAGSENPYNYNGTGYDGVAAPASSRVDFFDLASGDWQQLPARSVATMDHRGLLEWQGQLLTIGGMNDKQQVIDKIIRYEVAN
ncbi:Kelch repeat-containing protein [Corallincola luteus]|uniref:Kelch repeat-containing protein n=1 Tax=Corallincola luteus TaxID=1775177 RepID=UPI001F0D05D5|nr:galactose oxidase [Corallincola luteus]